MEVLTDVMSQTPPPLHGPSEKEKKYDRQLRLWAASGQAALESSNILLVPNESGTVGVEILKNLVLPGIGKFTIYDPQSVQEHDLGINFFLDETSLGKSRAQYSTEYLKELNPEVQGDWLPKTNGSTFKEWLGSTTEKFTLIIYILPTLEEECSKPILEYAARNSTPVVPVNLTGFYSYFQVKIPGAFPVVETHPDIEATADLRLLAPWPELVDFAKEVAGDLESLDDHNHGHVPMVVILLHYLQKWKDSHDGKYPSSYPEKAEFRKCVDAAMRRNNAEGGEENFEEAVGAVMQHVVYPSVPSSVKDVLKSASEYSDSKSNFWVIAKAVEEFHSKHGVLPLSGSVPDMKAQSGVYIKLQNLYKAKARKDANEVLATVHASSEDGGETCKVTFDEVEIFCTNARFIKLINAKMTKVDISDVAKAELSDLQDMEDAEPQTPPNSLLPIYLVMSALEHVDVDDDDKQNNLQQKSPPLSLESLKRKVADRYPFIKDTPYVLKVAEEVWRAGGGELHNISALTAGMVAQEIIKIVTKQYVPIDNTCIFDGIQSRTQIFRL